MTHSSMLVAKAPKMIPTPTTSPSTSKTAKLIDEGILEELIKGFKKLKMKMNELKKGTDIKFFPTI